jgi:endonuclease/exonuclease/phosphatase family metal-dependent hydrolase
MTAELTLASWNLHWGRGHKWLRFPPFDVVEGCKRLDADVLVLQECWVPDDDPEAGQHLEVARALGYDVAASRPLARAVAGSHPRVVGRADGDRTKGTGDWTLALLSRLPVERTSVTRLPQLRLDPCNRAVLHAEVRVGDRSLAVHGTHLAHLEVGSLSQRGALRDCLGPADRPAVLVGDMNMWGPWLARVVPAGWRVAGRGRTYPARTPHSRLDHLVHTAGVEVRAIEVVPDRGSDHRPIRARLRVVR